MQYLFPDFNTYDYYLFLKTILALFIVFGSFVLNVLKYDRVAFKRNDKILLVLFVSLVIVWAGTRGIKVGTDTSNYHDFFFLRSLYLVNYASFFAVFQSDPLFEVLMFFTFFFRNFTVFTLAVAIIFNVVLYIFVRRFTNYGENGSSLLLFLTFGSLFSFNSLELNIVRNALAIAFLLIGMHHILNKSFKKSMVFFLVAFLFHGSSIIPIAAISLSYYLRNLDLKYFIGIYLVTILLAYVGFGFHLVPILQNLNGHYASKLAFEGETTYRIGFRYDFVLYNTFFLFVLLRLSNLNSLTEKVIFKYFIVTSCVFFLNFYIPFSDRLGVYSWIAIPLLIYSVFKNNYPKKQVYLSSIGVSFLFILNYFILFP